MRIRQEIASKYRRRSNRTREYLSLLSKKVVSDAKAQKQVIVFEDVIGIGKLYRRGNGQTKSFRAKMNSWPFHEIKR